MRRDEDGRVETAGVVLQRLPAAVVIDARPRRDRPAVVQLPEDGAHGFGAAAAEVLCANLYSFGLQDLADIKKAGEVFGLGIILEQIVMDDRVAFVVLLMGEHHGREDIRAIGWLGERLNCLHLWERLKPIFSDEAFVMRFVSRKRNATVPHIPDMGIAALIVSVDGLIIRAGRAGPIWNLRFETRDDSGQDAAEFSEVVLPHLIASIRGQAGARSPALRGFGLVVAAPDDDAGMIAQAADLVFRFGFDIEFEVVGPGLPVITEHEVLPDHDA